MSAIAEVLLHEGLRVSGSDAAPSDVTTRLASLGVEFHAGHAPRTWDRWMRWWCRRPSVRRTPKSSRLAGADCRSSRGPTCSRR